MSKHDSTPLDRRKQADKAWSLPRADATCERCRDAGWFIVREGSVEFAWTCDCEAGDKAPKGLPRWGAPPPAPPPPPPARAWQPPNPPPARWGADRAAGPEEDS